MAFGNDGHCEPSWSFYADGSNIVLGLRVLVLLLGSGGVVGGAGIASCPVSYTHLTLPTILLV